MKSLSLYIFGSWAWFVFTIIALGMIVCFPFTGNFESTRNLAKNGRKCNKGTGWVIRLHC